MGVTNLSALRKFGSVGVDLEPHHLKFILNTNFDLSNFVRSKLDEEIEYYDWTADNKKATKELVKARDELITTNYKLSEAIEQIAVLYNRTVELNDDITELLYNNSKDWREEISLWRSTNEPINKREEGYEFHHLHLTINGEVNKRIGIYIPKELHRSIHHNSTTGKGMKQVNKAALLWLCEQSVI